MSVVFPLRFPPDEYLALTPPLFGTPACLRWLSPVSSEGFGVLRRNHEWRSASAGVIRSIGSRIRHRRMKSTNCESSQSLSAFVKSFDDGGPRYFPLRDLPPAICTCPSVPTETAQYLG